MEHLIRNKEVMLENIKNLEAKAYEHAEIVGKMKAEGLSYQWHDDKCNGYVTQLDLLTTLFLKNH